MGERQVGNMKHKYLSAKRLTTLLTTFAFSVMLPAALFGSLFVSNASALQIQGGSDCSDNSVIDCGVTSTDAIISYLPGHTAILDLYDHSFGINQDDINNLDNTTQNPNEDYTVAGTVNVNNDVIVDGKIVATNAITAGRENISNAYGSSSAVSYAGYTFYTRSPRVSFITASIDAFVVMKNGQFQFAILAPCGNPVKATPVPVVVPKPVYTCDSLTAQVSSSDPSTVVMGVAHTASGGAVFKNVTYTIDNITTGVTTTVPNASDSNVSYTFPNYGTQNITATVYFTLSGATVSNSGTGGDCTKSVAYAMPPPTTPPASGTYSCSAFNITPAPNDGNSIVVTSTETTTGDATFTQSVYDFGDGSSNDQTISTPGTSTVNYTYSNPGTYIVSVTDTFSVNGSNISVVGNCEGQVTIPPPPSTPMCTIAGLTQYASNSPNCVVVIPPSNTTPNSGLVNTGPGGVGTFLIILGVAAAVSGGGYYLLLKHRSKDSLDEL
jgi:hypothetical protein